MLVFVTGANGFIGQATVRELLKNGHQVLGLARTDAQVEALTAAGAEPHRGNLKNLDSLRNGAKSADGVIHLAFIHDFNDLAAACAVDREAIKAMSEGIAGTGKPLVIASGTLSLPKGYLVNEDTEPEAGTAMMDRRLSADLVYAFSQDSNIRGSVVRLAPTVHGAGDHGLIPMVANAFREKGAITYVGDGSQRWNAVYRDDAAVLLRLALENGTAGATYHAVAEEGVSHKDIWTLVGKKLGLPVEGKPAEEVVEAIGFFGYVIGMDNPTSSQKTQRELGWQPEGPGLLADIEANYFV